MVEGHSVHRVASMHRRRLVGKTFKATSPNGRLKEGAEAIDGKPMYRIEAVGKNLFAFFGNEDDPIVIHVHFGMAGNWAVFENDDPPEPTQTNRLRLECPGITADLSAMTVQHGGIELYKSKRSKLGEDPLREDADPESLWSRVHKSTKSIGALIMDQSFFCGPGNIYRAEILFKAGIHPDIPGKELTKEEFDTVWFHTVQLLKRGYETGSILTVDPAEARGLGKPKLRRYIYNTKKCPRCNTSITTWQIASRTCYACPSCQPLKRSGTIPVVTPEKKKCMPFNSRCAPESIQERLQESGPARLTLKEIQGELVRLGAELPPKANKAALVKLLETTLSKAPAFVSPEDAAIEKALAGESLAVEHIAELAPAQARKARLTAIPKVSDTTSFDQGQANLMKLTLAQLKVLLSDRSISFPPKAKKAVLIELLENDIVEAKPDYVQSVPKQESQSAREMNMREMRIARRNKRKGFDSIPVSPVKRALVKSE